MVRKFTKRLKWQPLESLSSYLMRMCEANGHNLSKQFKEIYNLKYGRFRSFRAYYIDIAPERVVDVKKLSSIFSISNDDLLHNNAFTNLLKKFQENNIDNDDGVQFKILIKGYEQRYRRFCPSCIKNKGSFNTLWQIKEIEICDVHRIPLENSCPYCSTYYPYLTDTKLTCQKCNFKYEYKSNVILDQEIVDDQLLKYSIWNFLISPDTKLTNGIKGLTYEKALAILFLYVSQNCEIKYKSTSNLVFSKDEANCLRYFILDEKYYKKIRRPNLSILLRILQSPININIEGFSNIIVPKEFIDSVMELLSDYPKKCLTVWCPRNNTDEKMKKIDVYYKNQFKHKNPSVCTDCFIFFGENKKTGIWEEISNKTQEILYVMELLESGESLKLIRRKSKISSTRVYEIQGYLLAHNLLSTRLRRSLLSKIIKNKYLVSKMFKDLIESTNSYNKSQLRRKSKEIFKWNMCTFYYYYAFVEVQSYIIFDSKKETRVPQEVKDQIINRIKILVEDNIKVTVENVLEGIQIDRDFLKVRGLNYLLIEAKEKQITLALKLLMNKVDKFVEEKKQKNETFNFNNMLNNLGVQRNTLFIKYPTLFEYCLKLVRDEKQEQIALKRQAVLQKALKVIEVLRKNGEEITFTKIANLMNISETTLLYYRKKGKFPLF
ncbi:TniQ family protein [Paenibacillus radicis (ex Xue et al. 2023)]|uniref:TniQ family protein n=1 Tax=Paenibacillus radicis (ex Xue et al. 2023) TaxID=2972489 RepID=A0ABT1YJ43_9BACL|nr:TniQ family protein [Paenibacillus radicis (ex Xue et al. 2023)]MCR8633203.1 TniQ family protein [Paenibacillus radicis (ex Xue et al. 2023)]